MVKFLFDQHVPAAVANGLRVRGVDVVTTWEDGSSALEDEPLLERAQVLSRVLVTQDEDFLVIASAWPMAGREFPGIVYAHQLRIGIGQFIGDLEIIAKASVPAQMRNWVEHLPL
jgi:hypothetical protein